MEPLDGKVPAVCDISFPVENQLIAALIEELRKNFPMNRVKGHADSPNERTHRIFVDKRVNSANHKEIQDDPQVVILKVGIFD